jgi:phosphotransferase system, enzyme I, PtsP
MATATSAASAREILTGLHDVMASKFGAQAKLNKVVKIIAEAMASEVCSIYLLRDGVLELFATVGLNQEAVHVTRLALGEGLVGTIARDVEILNLDEAASHPEFAYRPECRSSARSGRSASSPSSMPSRALMTISRSRRCRRWRWCFPS